MTRNHLWKLVIILGIIAWSIYQVIPPSNEPLDRVFRARAYQADTNFTAIMARFDELQQKSPKDVDERYTYLLRAIGTNDITRYFPFIDAKAEINPTTFILNRLQRESAGKIKLGIDLKGGTSVRLKMNTSALPAGTDIGKVLAEAVEVIRKRVDRRGVAEPIIQPQGNDEILVQLPGLTAADREETINLIKQAAFLQFRWVHPNSDSLLKMNIVEHGYEIMKRSEKGPDGSKEVHPYLVEIKPAGGLTGKNVRSVYLDRDPMAGIYVGVDFDTEGGEIFARLTKENIGRQLAIVLDGELRSAPVIKSEIPNGKCRIDGGATGFAPEEAIELANVLQNPLKAPLEFMHSDDVDPSLGKDTINSGMWASLIGTAAVSLFMLIYYMRGGLVANIALVINIIILFGVMCSVGTTITMPGIAGIVLTIGMAVDANVLIFERLREELAAGKSMRGAIAAGYNRAFGTIFDSHVTTLISSVILIFMGTGPVKGFGVALTIGVSASLFTALVVTRLIFDWLLSINRLKSLHMLHLIKGTHLDFMKLAVPAFTISWTLIVIGIGYGFYRGRNALGVDFAGGDSRILTYSQKIPTDEIRKFVDTLGFGEPTIQSQHDVVAGSETLRITTAIGSGDKVTSALTNKFPSANFEVKGKESVGATVGEEIQRTAILASLLSLFGILVYVAFRYEFSFAIGAVIAVLHDVLMTLGWFFLSGRQLNAPMVAAVLTIIGFSINDTIVIFDRIREDLKLGVKGTFREVMNRALNQTLSRTLITSGTVFLATMSLYLFGGGAINDFAFTFLVGIITGTYSSIYIASAIVLWWHKGQRPNLGAASQLDVPTPTSPAPARA